MSRRIAIAAGGTAGHVHPALAVADAYRVLDPDVEIVFLGTAGGIETRLVPPRGYRFHPIPGSPLQGVGPVGKVRAVATLVRGTAAARTVLRTTGTDLVVGFGGYAAAGAILAARTLGIASVVHEANAVAGMANRWLGRFADRVLLGFPSAATDFPPGKTIVTGFPIDAALAIRGRAERDPRTRPEPAGFRILILGGSGGSAFLNARVPELLARVAGAGVALTIHHQSGARDHAAVREAYERAGLDASVSAYIDDMAAAYHEADFAITCAGAATLAELAAVRLPALLVPLASAALDHQRANAREFAAMTGSLWTTEDAWQVDHLAATLLVVARSPTALLEAGTSLRKASRPQAARIIVAALERMRRH